MTIGVLLALLWLLQLGDYWSTRRALRDTRIHEGNPLVRGLGLVVAKIVAGSIMTVALLVAGPFSTSTLLWCVGPLVAWYGWVIYHNLTVSR